MQYCVGGRIEPGSGRQFCVIGEDLAKKQATYGHGMSAVFQRKTDGQISRQYSALPRSERYQVIGLSESASLFDERFHSEDAGGILIFFLSTFSQKFPGQPVQTGDLGNGRFRGRQKAKAPGKTQDDGIPWAGNARIGWFQ